MNSNDPLVAVDISIPADADPGDVAEGLIGILAAVICSMSSSRHAAKAGARAVGKDLTEIVGQLWDESTGATH